MLNRLLGFGKDQSGAVTVDWVVLTGAVVGLGLLVLNSMGGSINTAAENIAATVVANATN